jgi:phage terminase small subunit
MSGIVYPDQEKTNDRQSRCLQKLVQPITSRSMSTTIELWWTGLTERQRAFCETYSNNGGNALDAARTSGYSHPEKQAHRLLENVGIKAALEKLRATKTSKAIATREDRQAFWTAVANDPNVKMTDRLKASELLAKSQADFLTRTEVTGPGGGPMVTEVQIKFVDSDK